MNLPSYPKVYNLGHAAIKDLLNGEVVVQEKVDGSQFSFGVIGGELHMRSKGAVRHIGEENTLFEHAIKTVVEAFRKGELREGWVYRGEAFARPRHNTLAYTSVPRGNIALFDVDIGLEDRISPEALPGIAAQLGVISVPEFFRGEITDRDQLNEWMDQDSFLGGSKIEGVVIKNYNAWNNRDGKMLMGKHVSERFKEKHNNSWNKRNPTRTDIIQRIIETYCHEGRWRKAIQHLAENDELEHSPRDIGPLIKEIQRDVKEEEGGEIAQALFDHFWKSNIRKAITSGFPEFYKGILADQQFMD